MHYYPWGKSFIFSTFNLIYRLKETTFLNILS